MSNWGSDDLVSDFAQWNVQSKKIQQKQNTRGQSSPNRNQNWNNNRGRGANNDNNAWGRKPANNSEPKNDQSSGWNTVASKNDQSSSGWNTAASKNNQSSSGWNTTTSKNDQPSSGWSTAASKNNQSSSGWNTAASKNDQSSDWNTSSASNNQPASGWNKAGSNKGQSSSGWNTAAADNSWNKAGQKKEQASTPDWGATSAAPSSTPAASSGWDTPESTATTDWGSMTFESLGWDGKGKKADKKEDGKGSWENGKHLLSEPNEKLEVKLFGTADDKEVQHSGINFDKYNDIPVDTNGENVTPLEKFENPPLDKDLLKNIELARYVTPTPVQKYSIPIVLSGRDLMACAQTGSGKTAGFLFPILSALFTNGPLPNPEENKEVGYRSHRKAYPQALILAPTRELASQIYIEAKKFCYRSFVSPCVAYGGADIQTQLRLIDRGCHLLVATPGRLVDILERRRISFKNIQYLVLDEADRMLDMGFEPQIRRIVEGEDMPSPKDRQNLLFSATFPENIQILARDFMKGYVFLSVGRVGATSENINQIIELVNADNKRDKLLEVLKQESGGLTLIFTETKRMADSLFEFLLDNRYRATVIHGDRVQSEREAALASFKKGETPIMVATAVAARGLDIPNVTHVISFDLPNDIDDYVHRIGRTGRAGNTGLATALFTKKNAFIASDLVKLLTDAHQPVPAWLEEMATQPVESPPPGRGYGRGRPNNSRSRNDDFGLRIRPSQMR